MSEDDKTTSTAGGERDSTSEHSTDRGADRGTRDAESGGERSGGRRDRSRELLREDIERQFERASGRPRDWDADRAEPRGRAARAAKEAAAEGSPGGEQLAGIGHNSGETTPLDVSNPPAAWAGEAKRAWAQLPAEVQAAVAKREVDSARGVEELKKRYSEIDQALAPHLPTIQKFGHRPGAAVSQLFNWFSYLHQKPLEAFPALVRSMGAEKVFQQQLQQQQAAQQQQQQQQQLDPFQQYAQSVEQRLNGFQQTIQQQQEAAQLDRCNAVIAEFGKTHPHLDRVRVAMAAFLQPDANGRSLIGLTPSGEINLQAAYDAAVRADPTLGEQLITERIAARAKTQREQAEKARYSGNSLRPAAPGSGSSTAPKKRSGAKSVRDSINDALLEIRDA